MEILSTGEQDNNIPSVALVLQLIEEHGGGLSGIDGGDAYSTSGDIDGGSA